MESNWRMNVYRFVGSTFSQWNYPSGVGSRFTHLCAVLNPTINFFGRTWTHLLKISSNGDAYISAFARFHDPGNVLDEIFLWQLPGHFPHGFGVLPDH